MLRIVFFIWCGLLLGACRSEMHPEIYVRIAGAKKDFPTTLCIGGREFSITLDSVGSAVFVFARLAWSFGRGAETRGLQVAFAHRA